MNHRQAAAPRAHGAAAEGGGIKPPHSAEIYSGESGQHFKRRVVMSTCDSSCTGDCPLRGAMRTQVND